jgi:predicted nucleotidyltransferase
MLARTMRSSQSRVAKMESGADHFAELSCPALYLLCHHATGTEEVPSGDAMRPLIRNRLTELEAACHRRAVSRLELFGSAVRDDFDERTSDLDFLVEFDAATELPALDRYFGLKEDLEALFERPVDLVMPNAVRNPYLRAEIERDRRLLYAA